MKLRLIGYWRGADESGPWPDPTDLVDWSWDGDERRRVVRYLTGAGTTLRVSRGRHRCRICDERHGAVEVTDGTYVWPDGLVHYVKVHGVRLPDEFVRHVSARLADLCTAAVDGRWWLRQTSPRRTPADPAPEPAPSSPRGDDAVSEV